MCDAKVTLSETLGGGGGGFEHPILAGGVEKSWERQRFSPLVSSHQDRLNTPTVSFEPARDAA